MNNVIIDCTELYKNPVRTGIQRVVRELLRHWPEDGAHLHVARFEPGVGLIGLPDATIRMMTDDDTGGRDIPPADLAFALAASAAESAPHLPSDAIHLIPEVFYDPARCAFYMELIDRRREAVALIAFDFIPVLYPWIFNLRTALPFMEYIRLVQSVEKIGHISERTRIEYIGRITRNTAKASGVVLRLGSDGMELESQEWSDHRRGFVSIGSLDGWKNQQLMVEAFVRLWEKGRDTPLTIIGRAYDNVDLTWLDLAKQYSQFRWLDNASDLDIAAELRNAVATIYLADLAGFGLPPVESLFAGIPVVTTHNMPSLEGLPSLGEVRLNRLDADHLAEAIERFDDSDFCRSIWSGASKVNLPTWKDFSEATALWIGAGA